MNIFERYNFNKEKNDKQVDNNTQNINIKKEDTYNKNIILEEEPVPNDNANKNNSENIRVKLDSPYPDIVDAQPNIRDIRMLKYLAYGKDSELTAILTYLYQSYIVNDKELSDVLTEISESEMIHYDLLSEAVVEFGGDPTLTDGRGNVWTGRNITTLTNPTEILISNIKNEKGAIENYKRAIKETDNKSLIDLYNRIIEDEKIHIQVFEKFLEKIK